MTNYYRGVTQSAPFGSTTGVDSKVNSDSDKHSKAPIIVEGLEGPHDGATYAFFSFDGRTPDRVTVCAMNAQAARSTSFLHTLEDGAILAGHATRTYD